MVPAETEAILAAAANKLRLKKKDVAKARLYVWSSGDELPRKGSAEGRVQNGDLVAVSLGEPFLGRAAKLADADSGVNVADNVGGSSAAGNGDEGNRVASMAAGTRWVRWEPRPAAGSLAVLEWSDAATMNATLGRMSSMLEHPQLCIQSQLVCVAMRHLWLLPPHKKTH